MAMETSLLVGGFTEGLKPTETSASGICRRPAAGGAADPQRDATSGWEAQGTPGATAGRPGMVGTQNRFGVWMPRLGPFGE